MKTSRKRRLLQMLAAVLAGGLFIALVIYALVEDSGAFLSPGQLAESPRPTGTRISLGGWVQNGSWRSQALLQTFTLADDEAQIRVYYQGLLPDLFAEGEAAVATGRLRADGGLDADEVLAKHDENYRPPGVPPPPSSSPSAAPDSRPPLAPSSRPPSPVPSPGNRY